MKKRKNKLATAILGSALMSASAFAGMGGSCGSGKCGAGKCGGSMKNTKKEMMLKGKNPTQSKVNKDDDFDDEGFEEGSMSGNSGKKSTMSCGTGKCGNM